MVFCSELILCGPTIVESGSSKQLFTTWLFNCRCVRCSKNKIAEYESDEDYDNGKYVDNDAKGSGDSSYSRCAALTQIACNRTKAEQKQVEQVLTKIVYPCVSSLHQLVSMLSDRIKEISGPSSASLLV